MRPPAPCPRFRPSRSSEPSFAWAASAEPGVIALPIFFQDDMIGDSSLPDRERHREVGK